MNYTLEIKKLNTGWVYEIRKEGEIWLLAWGNNFKSAKNALEACSKKLLELLPKETFDFGQGEVDAHQHKNGGGWVADTAHVDDTAYVGSGARVFENAKVLENAKILDSARVFNYAKVYEYAVIRNNVQVFESARVFGNAEVAEYAWVFGKARLCGNVKICGYVRFCSASLYGENK